MLELELRALVRAQWRLREHTPPALREVRTKLFAAASQSLPAQLAARTGLRAALEKLRARARVRAARGSAEGGSRGTGRVSSRAGARSPSVARARAEPRSLARARAPERRFFSRSLLGTGVGHAQVVRTARERLASAMDRARQQAVFDDWLRAHEGLLVRIVRAYAFTPHDREDALQEIALQLWNSIPGFRGEAKVTTWIYRVALRSAMAWSRRERAHRDAREPLAEPGQVLARPIAELDPRLEWIYAQIAKLEAVDRALILLHLDGLAHREIAETLGISEGHVAVKLSRIKKTMANAPEHPGSPRKANDGP